ncbi:Mur ligase [Lipomyces japonicus]|uniref:Mur ligase n=1 Tax=Lipomyces japonicus TaxID=56871 RepID=UPI0034CD9CDC
MLRTMVILLSPRQTRRYATRTRTFKDAIECLNSLQTNFATLEMLRNTPKRTANSAAIPEMIEWVRRIGYSPEDLDRMNVIHVTGTKGKGSTCAFTASILAQYKDEVPKVGLYTSPHLRSVRERIAINGEPISERQFTQYFFDVWDRLEKSRSDETLFPTMGVGSRPVYFRFMTLLSFHVFLSEQVNAAVYEVGVGGEYDSTNVVPHPTAVGIARIGLDHTRVLGNTVAEIAWHKAGIMKHGTTAFSVEQPAKAWPVVQARATEPDKQVKLVSVGVDDYGLRHAELGLQGEFQAVNASLAVALAREHLAKVGVQVGKDNDEAHGVRLLPKKFAAGLRDARWPGRCQTIVDGEVEWLIDGAHTADSIEAAARWFRTRARPGSRKILVFNQQTRDGAELLRILHGELVSGNVKFDAAVFTTNLTGRPDNDAGELAALNTSEADVQALVVQNRLADAWREVHHDGDVEVTATIADAVKYVRETAPVQVFAVGSLHLVGGLLVVLDK